MKSWLVIGVLAVSACGNKESRVEQRVDGASIVTVYGTARDASSAAPAPGLTVDVFDAGTAALVTSTVTRALDDDPLALQHNFKIDLAAGRSYVFRFSGADRVTTFLHHSAAETPATVRDAQVVPITAGPVFYMSPDVRVRRSIGRLRIDARLRSGGPAPGATVQLLDRASLSTIAEVATDDAGRAELDVPARRDFIVRATGAAYAPAYAMPDPSSIPALAEARIYRLDPEGFDVVDLRLSPARQRFSGVVLRPDDTPADDAECTARDATTAELLAAVSTDAAGAIAFELPAPQHGFGRTLDVRCQDRAGQLGPARTSTLLDPLGGDQTLLLQLTTSAGTPAPDRGRISGIVTSLGGTVDGVAVSVIDAKTAAIAATTTTLGGSYAAFVPAGDYVVQISDPAGRHLDAWSGGAVHVAPGGGTTVSLQPPSSNGTFTMAPLTVCAGREPAPGVGGTHVPATGTVVTVIDPATFTVAARATLGADPCTSITVPAPLSYFIQFREPSGAYDSKWVGAPFLSELSQTVQAVAVGPTGIAAPMWAAFDHRNLKRSPPNSASGPALIYTAPSKRTTIIDAETLAVVAVRDGGGPVEVPPWRRYLVRFTSLPSLGSLASLCGYAFPISTSARCVAPDLAFALKEALPGHTLELSEGPMLTPARPTGMLAGRIVDPAGQPIAGAEVIAFEAITGTRRRVAISGADGHFAGQLVNGPHTVAFTDPGHRFATYFFGGAARLDLASPVFFADHDFGTIALADPLSPPTTARVFGVATGFGLDGARPAANIDVTVLTEDGGRVAGATTDELGAYAIDVPPGSYRISFADPRRLGPWAAHLTSSSVFEAGTQSQVDLGLTSSAGTVSARLDGDAQVAIYDERTLAIVATPPADGSGALRFELPPGRYAMRTGGISRLTVYRDLIVQESAQIDLSHVSSPPFATGQLGIALAAAGAPREITGARIDVRDADTFELVRSAPHDPANPFIDGLPAGAYFIIASAPDFRSAIAGDAVRDVVTLPIGISPLTLEAGASRFVELALRPIPRADAGPDQTVHDGVAVTLDGSASTGDALYAWSQLAGPPVTLAGATTARASFTSPTVGSAGAVLTFQLQVDNGFEQTTDTVDVIVIHANRPPTAAAGADQTVSEGSLVRLDGAASYDLDDDTLTFAWEQLEGPAVTLADAASAHPSFVAPLVGRDPAALVFRLRVRDAAAETEDTVSIVVENINHAPIAVAGPDAAVIDNAIARLDGSASGDPDGDALTYAWTQVSGPAVELSNPASAAPTFVPPAAPPAGLVLVFELVVSDGLATASDRVTVAVSAHDQPPRCDFATATPQMIWPPNKKLVKVGIGGVTDPDGETPVIAITEISQDEPRGGTPDAAIVGGLPYVRAERAGSGDGRVYRIRFTATAGSGSCSGEVRVCVRHDACSSSCGAGSTWYPSY